VQFLTNANVSAVTPPNEDSTLNRRPSVTLTDGRKLEAHVVIGADGAFSTVRKIMEDTPVKPSARGYVCYSGLLPSEKVRNDQYLREDDIAKGVPVWCGLNHGMIGTLADFSFVRCKKINLFS
jgi:flavin-dependent dehydrogenase